METIIAIARARPLPPARFNRPLERLVRRALSKIEHCRCAAVQRGAADLLWRRTQQIFVAARKRDRHAAMDMRVDAARHHDLTAGVDDTRGAGRLEAARPADGGDLAAGDADICELSTGRHDRGAAGDEKIEHSALANGCGYTDSLPAHRSRRAAQGAMPGACCSVWRGCPEPPDRSSVPAMPACRD